MSLSLFRVPIYSSWFALPDHLLPIFLLVLSLHTCLPLPPLAALTLGVLISVANLAAITWLQCVIDGIDGVTMAKKVNKRRSCRKVEIRWLFCC